MAEIEFKEGDVVKLKSGGLSMTIEAFTWNAGRDEPHKDRVNCIWFDNKKLMKESFPTIVLEHV